MRAKTIYIAGPISNGEAIGREGWLPNIIKACEVGARIIELGHNPIVPHLAYYLEEHAGVEFSYEDWLRVDFGLIRASDALLRMEGESKGADREVEYARDIGKIVFMSIPEIPKPEEWL